MHTLKTFFETTLDQDLPFVVYRKPGAVVVKAFKQHDKTLHYLSDFTEQGFVFAPFDTQRPTILFPSDQLERYTFSIPNDTGLSNAVSQTQNDIEKQRYLDLVKLGIRAIQEGKMEKVVLSRKQNTPLNNQNPYPAISRLLLKYPAAFVYCWYHPEVGLWLGATPETLLTIKNRQLETMALAGTQTYTGSVDVAWGDKEKREQELVTEAIVQNLKPLFNAQPHIQGPYTSRAGNLLHLKTTIKVPLEKSKTPIKTIIQALHPTPAICGYPKAAAKSFITANENYDRAYYTGYLGELNIKETTSRSRDKRNIENQAYHTIKTTTSLFVNLRCMQWQDNQASIYVGGGITAASIPEQEWEETVNKLQTMHTIL